MATVELNKPVPNFIAQATSKKDILLAQLKGWRVVIYFYPKDNTPGCTTESQDFRDYYEDLKSLKTVVFGVSKDSLKSHEEFKEKQQLPFELISDSNGKLCELFDVIRPQNMYGKQVMSLERSTFLIDEHGVLKKEWRKVRVNGHADEVVEAVEELAGV
ncbi:MAG: peroxiredoxin [Gammaproteobacteria bacterium]|nr:MAG: peroxiredoxin [Gammaproteobacteria bacterium]